MQPSDAGRSDSVCRIVAPLRWDVWRDELQVAGCLDEFADISIGIRDGFRISVSLPITATYTPPNHKSSLDNPEALQLHIHTELSARRYSGPFHPSRLESLIGPFCTSPMGIIPKTTPGTFRIIQDFSFPRDNPSIFSVNDDINPDEFQCEWGTFVACVLLIADAPEGTQASVNDVQNAYRNIPIHPDDQPYLVIFFLGLVILDHCAAFGSCSAPGIFGRVADAIVQIFKHYGVQAIIKWVDDFVFWRYPTRKLIDGSFEYSYDESLIFSVAERLGWPWSPTKHTPFSSSFTYNGFQWDIPSRTVELPASKKVKYLERLAPWISGATFTRKECEKMVGTLNHCCLTLPEGRSRLPSFYRFASGFHYSTSIFARHRISTAVLEDAAWW